MPCLTPLAHRINEHMDHQLSIILEEPCEAFGKKRVMSLGHPQMLNGAEVGFCCEGAALACFLF